MRRKEHRALPGLWKRPRASRCAAGYRRAGTSRSETPRLLAEAGYRWYGDVFDDDLPYVLESAARRSSRLPLGTDVNDMPS